MRESAVLRRMIVDYQLMSVVDPTHVEGLRHVLAGLRAAAKELSLDMSYEIAELEKDIVYLEGGDEALFDHLAGIHDGFADEVDRTMGYLADLTRHLFVTDRDGTVNNYCARYRTSVQSVYNAVYLTNYARNRALTSVIVTSAPLEPDGIIEVMTVPRHAFVVAGSKGREFRDVEGHRHELPIPHEQQKAMDRLNQELKELLERNANRRFRDIGSGLQRKYGQTAVSYQDVSESIEQEESEAFRRRVVDVVRSFDPEARTFHIEDTGYDLEIILSVDDSGETSRDFDKSDGVRFIDTEIDLGLDRSPALVCGDTSSDVAMLRWVVENSPASRAVLVSTDNRLIEDTRAAVPDLLIVSTPDVLVASLGRLGSMPKEENQ